MRVLIVAAHPDDEIVSAGALASRLSHAGALVRLIHITDGAPRNGADARAHGFASCAQYAAARRQELVKALACAGIVPECRHSFDVPDQEAAFHLTDIARHLADELRAREIDLVLTHPYEGGHPDHDATAFAVRAAWSLAAEPRARIREFTSYHICDGNMRTGAFLESPGAAVETLVLTGDERARKRRACACFETQRGVLDSFPDDVERFRDAPAYRFDRPPHAGRLFYEYFDWGLTSARWCGLTRDALRTLDLGLDRVCH